MVLHEWLAFYSAFLNIHRSGVLTALAGLVPHETAAIHHPAMHHVTSCKAGQKLCMRVKPAYRATCAFGRTDDLDLLRATAVTRGWNWYRNKSQHRKSTLEKKILPPLQQGFEPATFQSRVRRSNHWAIPATLLMSRVWKNVNLLTGHENNIAQSKLSRVRLL